MNKEEFKDLFLRLTEWTVPFGTEKILEPILPDGFKQDSVGNYYYQIGNSKTLFTSHLDTYCRDHERVNHVISKKDPYHIKTDGTTILGGDNKLGCSILIGMIQNNIPGTYYFFIGEEPILSGGLYGSQHALNNHPEFFEGFERCIAFDRRGYGSIVIRQMARMCCSKEFATSIADNFDIHGIKWDQEGGYGYYTDTAAFMDVIPECTNISAGGFKEHYKTEWVDLNYTYSVLQAALNTDWESLPVKRELEDRFSQESVVGEYQEFTSHKKNLEEIESLFSVLGMKTTRNTYKSGVRNLTFSMWLEDFDVDIQLQGDKIILDDEEVTMDELKEDILLNFEEEIYESIKWEVIKYQKGDKKAGEKAIGIMKSFNIPMDKLKDIIS